MRDEAGEVDKRQLTQTLSALRRKLAFTSYILHPTPWPGARGADSASAKITTGCYIPK